MTSTIFDQNAYDDGIRDAIAKVIDDWGFRYPGIDNVEHVYFYAATAASPETIQAYLEQAYDLGKDFGLPRDSHCPLTTEPGRRVTRPLRDRLARLVSGRPDVRCAPRPNTRSSMPCARPRPEVLRPLDIEPQLEIREVDETTFQQDPSASEPHLDRRQADGGMARRHRRKQPLLLRVRRLRMPDRRSRWHHLRERSPND